jgi:uncharacterized protein (TIGR02145 family)
MQRIDYLIVLLLLLNLPATLYSQTVRDADGNYYSTVKIGEQVWMVENLRTTKFNDGTPIPVITGTETWKQMKSPAFCWFNNEASNKDLYGALYNWYAVKTEKLCPNGWHVPAASEWDKLISFAGGEEVAGEKLKEIGFEHWKNSLVRATNEYGFTAIPGGMRFDDGAFPTFGNSYGVWWTTTGFSTYYAWNRGMFFADGKIYRGHDHMRCGYSVRCLKN